MREALWRRPLAHVLFAGSALPVFWLTRLGWEGVRHVAGAEVNWFFLIIEFVYVTPIPLFVVSVVLQFLVRSRRGRCLMAVAAGGVAGVVLNVASSLRQ
jgi:hypothetical protein